LEDIVVTCFVILRIPGAKLQKEKSNRKKIVSQSSCSASFSLIYVMKIETKPQTWGWADRHHYTIYSKIPYLEVDPWSRPFSIYKWFKKLLISRTLLSRIPRLSRSVFMVPNPNFTPLISKCSQIPGLFNIPGFATSPIYTCGHYLCYLLISSTAWIISVAVVLRTKLNSNYILLTRYCSWYTLFHYLLLLTQFLCWTEWAREINDHNKSKTHIKRRPTKFSKLTLSKISVSL
jgi:hypothetical protein